MSHECVAVVCLLVALILFPVMFMRAIDSYREEFNISHWYFSWSFGVAWGAVIFLAGAAVLLFVDRRRDDVLYKEKCYYKTDA